MNYHPDDVVVITPLYNEAHHLNTLLTSIKQAGLKKMIFGISPNSTDDTKLILHQAGIFYTMPKEDGYDFAIESALDQLEEVYPETKLVLFSEAHQIYDKQTIEKFLQKIAEGADLVMGIHKNSHSSSNWFEKIGTKLIIFPLQIFFRRKIRDISPFRMVRRELIQKFNLEPKKYRLPTEMIVKSLAMNLNIIELPVSTQEISHEAPDVASLIEKNTDPISALQFINFKPQES
jgi:glycosyltransferase involved in cell wall biosynthesis